MSDLTPDDVLHRITLVEHEERDGPGASRDGLARQLLQAREALRRYASPERYEARHCFILFSPDDGAAARACLPEENADA